jgi:hypothetical protein
MSNHTISMKCGCTFENGQAVADKVRLKGAANKPMPQETKVECDCGTTYSKERLIDQCPTCNMTYAVTPCSAASPEYIVPAGINY